MSRWSRASREDLEALAEHTHNSMCELSNGVFAAIERLRASCPPLRTEAEVAAEALAILRRLLADDAVHWDTAEIRALAKEPTR